MDKFSIVDKSKEKLVEFLEPDNYNPKTFNVEDVLRSECGWHLNYLHKEAKKMEKVREVILANKDLFYQKKEIFSQIERIIEEN